MKNLRKVFALLLALMMVLALCAACSNGDNPGGRDPDVDEHGNRYAGTMEENGNTYAQPGWLPVVKTPIKVTAMVRDPMISGNDYSKRTIWKEIADKTNINIELHVTTAYEPEQLMFASRAYTDIAFRIYTEKEIKEACYAGDILELTDELLETYAPNWYQVFAENPEIYKLTVQPDGKLYTLPQWYMDEADYMLRDMNVINTAWLDELGMSVPTTVNEYTDYLRAVKAAAGTGSIPENASPLYARMGYAQVNIGSHNNILDWFGVYQGFNYEIVENGVVKSNNQNPAIKPAIKYLAQLYAEGLLNDNCISNDNDWALYQTALGNDYDGAKGVQTVGSYFGFSISDAFKENYDAFAPLDATANGATEGPYARDFGADNRIIKNAFMIFNTCKYPIAMLRFADTYATGDNLLRAYCGEEGEDKQWVKLDDGTYQFAEDSWNHPSDTNCYGWNDTALGVVTPALVEQLARKNLGEDADHDERIWAYHNLYKDYLPTDKVLYPKDALNYMTTAENTLCDNYLSKVQSITNGYFKSWLTGKTDIDDDWDDFQKKLKDVGLNDRLALMQSAYDAYMANKMN